MATLSHSIAPLGPRRNSTVYVGCGASDVQLRPSVFCNPFAAFRPARDALTRFREYLRGRADAREWLHPLAGAECICDCKLGPECHGLPLIEYVNELSGFGRPKDCAAADAALDESLLVPSAGAVGEPDVYASDDDSDAPVVAAGRQRTPTSADDLQKLNETTRGSTSTLPPTVGWLAPWLVLVTVIRASPRPVFWEIFAGCAVLTSAFLEAGWTCAPPLDILDDEAFDLLNPLFVAIVLGLLLEGRCAMLHLGPPCSSFSMAVNRFIKHRMRTAALPGGLPNLNSRQQEKVRLGNALATVTTYLAMAQVRMKRQWSIEQPGSSIMWLFEPFLAFIREHCLLKVTVDVCAFGAPWKKPTTLAVSFPEAAALARKCPGCPNHIQLQGMAPCGRNWTAVASPYWPAFASTWASVCAPYWQDYEIGAPSVSHLSGFGVAPDSLTVKQILDMKQYNPSGKRSTFVAALRVCAGGQPSGHVLPALIPEGLGPETHLQVALATKHPMARPLSLPWQCEFARKRMAEIDLDMNKFRYQMLSAFESLAALLADDSALLQSLVHPLLHKVVAKRNCAFMREIHFLLGCHDPLIIVDYAFGLPMAGWGRHSPTLVQKVSGVPLPESSPAELESSNAKILAKAGPTGDADLDAKSWDKT